MEIQLNPHLHQYTELKQKHPDAIIMFRHGDFYRVYKNDANIVASVVGISCMANNQSSFAMCEFPRTCLDTYLPKLVRAGYRIAICDA